MAYRILLVDDEHQLRRMVGEILEQEGYAVLLAADCAQGETLFCREQPDAVLLDVMLPDGDGFSLFQKLRAVRDVPVLFLSARDEDEARLRGLGLGADDYITKPFLPQQQKNAGHENALRLGSRVVDWGAGVVLHEGESIPLTAKEYALLHKLWENRGNIVTVDALCAALWDGVLVGYENTLMVHIRRLREKIEDDPSHPRYLVTVRGLGYRLEKERAR